MKDSYSFDTSDEGLDASYAAHREAYIKTFDRFGFDYVIVKATSGAMGGSKSEEFLASSPVGEDTYVRCTTCDYAANVEAVQVRPPSPVSYDDAPAAHAEQTPDTPTIQTLVDHLNEKYPRDDRPWHAGDTLKNVLVVLKHADGRREPLAIGLPGDREVDQKRLEGMMEPTEVEPMDETDFAKFPTLVKGYIGPGALGEESESGIRYLLDPRVVEGTRWVTGADVHGSHVLDLVAGRDFTADGTIEAAEVRDGDPCPLCRRTGARRARSRPPAGIEMGHIFQLGRKYAEALDLKVLDENGKLVTVTMGSYGIGVSRAVPVIAEDNHDELGLIWPREVAPADVHLVATGKDAAVFEAAARLAEDLSAAGLEVIYDDRPKVSPGVKFKDSELIGVPTIVTVGRGLADGNVEVKDRRSGDRENVPLADAVEHLVGRARLSRQGQSSVVAHRSASAWTSSSVGCQRSAEALVRTCSARETPEMTEETVGWAASPAIATSRIERSRASAYASRASMRSQSAVGQPAARLASRSAREPLGAAWPRRYLPVSRPYSSGKNGSRPRPNRSQAGTSSRSTLRSSSE